MNYWYLYTTLDQIKYNQWTLPAMITKEVNGALVVGDNNSRPIWCDVLHALHVPVQTKQWIQQPQGDGG